MDKRLLSYLREQVRFLRSSAKAYDDGDEAEERRLATAIRVLVHDTGQSHSLLGQLGLKERLHWTDTRLRLPRDAGHILHTGLCLASMRDGDSRFTPVFHRLSPERSGHR